jgi:DNA repair protein RecN (Recombination protein N)
MMSFAVKEISEAKLKPNEDVELEEEQARLSSYEKLYSDADSIDQLLSDGDNGVIGLLKKIRRDSMHITELDKSLAALDERVESAFYELSDIADEFSSYKGRLVYDPNRLQTVEDRLSLIYNLKKKYASSVNAPLSEVFTYFDEAQKYIEENGEGNNRKEVLAAEIKALEKDVLTQAEKLSQARKATAQTLNSEVDSILAKLGMKGTTFAVQINQKAGTEVEQLCGPYGKDDIEFMISANPGNPPLPLAKIASGGELSRVMLALKTIFARTDGVETLIFDEIDTGIGGEVAVAVGAHIKNLAKKRQIFCITHLASIAVYADNQIKIEKSVSGEITSSNVYPVEGEARVAEIARMLSGDSDTAQSLEHARSLLQKFSGGN